MMFSSSHGFQDCPREFHTLNLAYEGHYCKLGWLTFGLNNRHKSHCIACLHDYLTKTRNNCIKIVALLLWLSANNIDCSLQLNTFDSIEKVEDFSAFVNSTVAMFHKALNALWGGIYLFQ